MLRDRRQCLLLQVEYSHDLVHPTGLLMDALVQGAMDQLDDVVGDLHRLILSLEGGGHGR